MRVATVGASGFIGSHVISFGRCHGVDMVAVKVPRLGVEDGESSGGHISDWPRRHRPEFERLSEALAGIDVVINAAGLARPGSRDGRALRAANTVLPAVVAKACRQAGVRRLVHVSTAAVQGRLDPLDESARHFPFSPYSRSKAEGERWLLGTADGPDEIVLYRPTSVVAAERHTTRQLARLAAAPFVPIAGAGSQSLPVALIDNVVAGIVFSATCPFVAPVVLQPWEGLTTRRVLELFASRRLVSLPEAPVRWGLRVMGPPAGLVPGLSTPMRSLELLLRGQRVAASALSAAGFVPPVGEAGWTAVAAAVRLPEAERRSSVGAP